MYPQYCLNSNDYLMINRYEVEVLVAGILPRGVCLMDVYA